MWEEFTNISWLLGTFLICVIGSYYLYSPEVIEYDYNTDLEVDSANTTSEDSDYDYKTSTEDSDDSDGSDGSDGSDKLYYNKEFLGELPLPFIADIDVPKEEYQTDIFEDSYVDLEGNVRTKYTFVSNDVKFK